MVIRFIGRRPEMERYMAVYHKGEENVIRFQMPIPYNNGRKCRLYLGETDVTDGFDYSNAGYIHMPVTVKRGGMTIWTSEPLWVDVVREEEDKLSEGKPYQQYVTNRDGKAVWKDDPLAVMSVHDDIVWDGNTDGLQMVTDNEGNNMYRMNVDLSMLKTEDFVTSGRELVRFHWKSGKTHGVLLSSDGKAAYYSNVDGYRVAFVEEGGEFEMSGATYAPGLWLKRTDTDWCERVEFLATYRKLSWDQLPNGIVPTCTIIIDTYSEEATPLMPFEELRAMYDTEMSVNFFAQMFTEEGLRCANMTKSIHNPFSGEVDVWFGPGTLHEEDLYRVTINASGAKLTVLTGGVS